MVQAVNRLLAERPAVHLPLTEADLAPYFALSDLPDPDLFIRTGGEQRISNFLLWQLAYTELYFTDTLWPDFDEATFREAVSTYRRRERRYGRVPGDAPAIVAGNAPRRVAS
jgi:undecaprenyl diphosphate synthase